MKRFVPADTWIPVGVKSLEPNALHVVRDEVNGLVVAGPGAGKTELLAQRACYLLQTGLCPPPHQILAISFKKDAAANLQPWQDMTTLVRLRNELVHYKSKWGEQMSQEKFISKTLPGLRLTLPPFVDSGSNYFPHLLLGAACAAWSVRTAVAFLDTFYERMGIESRLKPYAAQFKGL
jgi:hypothetical protein